MNLTRPQHGWLLLVEAHPPPGQTAPLRNRSLCALETRGLVNVRPDPTAPGIGLWTITPAGREQLKVERDR